MLVLILTAVIIVLFAAWVYAKLQTSDPDIILFYSPTCPACVAFEPVWSETEPDLTREGFTVLRANAKKHEDLFNKYGVNSVPTVLFLPQGASPIVYNGPRTKGSILAAAKQALLKK